MPKHLTPDEVDAILCYTYQILAVLRLSHYDIQVSDLPAGPDEFASMQLTEGRFFGSMRVAEQWSSKTEDEKCGTIIHECLHLAHAHVNSALSSLLEDNPTISRELFDTISRVYMNGMEYLVDGLTLVVQDGYNIPWPTKAQVRKFMSRYTAVT